MHFSRWVFSLCFVVTSGCSKSGANVGAASQSSPVVSPSSSNVQRDAATPSRVISALEAINLLCDGADAFPLEVAGSRHFVKATIEGPNGKEDVRLHVDTGGNTPGVVLDKDIAERLGFKDAVSIPRSLQIGRRAHALPEGASWSIFSDDFGKSTRKTFSGGQIGAGFLSRYIVCIDPASGRLGLGDPRKISISDAGSPQVGTIGLSLLKGGVNQALYPFVHGVLTSKGEIVGGYGLLLDTGAPASMAESNVIAYQHGKQPAWPYFEGASGDADMIGSAFPEVLLRAESVSLDTPVSLASTLGIRQPDPVGIGSALFVSRPTGTWQRMFGSPKPFAGSHGAIGNDVLNRFKILVDYSSSRLFLMPSARTQDPSASMVRLGVSLRFNEKGCPEVRAVASTNREPTKSGLKKGDIITKIGGADTCSMMHHEIMAMLAGNVGDNKPLTILREGAELVLTLPVADLLASPGP